MLRSILNLFGPSTASVSLADDRERIERELSTHRIASATIGANEVLSTHPPKIEHAKKQLLFDMALAKHPDVDVTVERFEEIPLPEVFQSYSPLTEVTAKRGYFRYSVGDAQHCYMNFAHHDLFNGYGHFMFAQDEIQVAEHPLLASVREFMLTRTDRLRPRTVEDGAPTPVVIRSVPRMISIDTKQIYGARFARSDDQLIRDSVQSIDTPLASNILAIEAPISAGNRIYTRSEIENALRTAFSGFRAFIIGHTGSLTKPIVLHTGNWGCGAYGGNRQLMISIQIMAASLSGISQIVFYCGADPTDSIAEFESQLNSRFNFRPGVKLRKVVDRLVNSAFPWGTPDGN